MNRFKLKQRSTFVKAKKKTAESHSKNIHRRDENAFIMQETVDFEYDDFFDFEKDLSVGELKSARELAETAPGREFFFEEFAKEMEDVKDSFSMHKQEEGFVILDEKASENTNVIDSSSGKCNALLNNGNQCVNNIFKSNYCRVHYNIKLSSGEVNE